MSARMRRQMAARNLDVDIMMAFLETHGIDMDDCYDLNDLLGEYGDDFNEYCEWYITCYA